ncbi:unnamed protein product [Rhizophagus irregularis]|nr:unnamed protein product [Rhizophagus irregularis]CAB4396256.1 unnamed protein product [Rhizophagus irregularis]CAB5383472.1 unnamed protein product [Rhizophagus irregularis]
MAIIVTFGSRVPVLQVSETAKCSGTPGIRNGKMFGGSSAPGFPKRKMFRYSKIPKRQHVLVLQDSETEKCLQFGYHWKVKMVPPLQIRTWVWITCRFRSITSKLQFKWFGDIWEANLGNMNLVKPLLNISHYFTFRYWIWLLKWLL